MTGVMMQKYSFKITGINYIRIENSYFNKQKYFTILLFLLYFGSNECRLGEQ